MKRADFNFTLPPELIAQYPTPQRTGSRLLYVAKQEQRIEDAQFSDLLNYLQPHDLLVFNNTKVIPARLLGQKATGGKVEILLERLLNEKTMLAQLRASKSPKIDGIIQLEQGFKIKLLARQAEFFVFQFLGEHSALQVLEQIGHIPLPPYIQRCDVRDDHDRYQTVFAEKHGAVAAPTAGLHFDHAMLATLEARGIGLGFITLHIGAGTFQPMRVENIIEHPIHSERMEVSLELCQQIQRHQQQGGRIIAVGTTTVRALETASQTGELQPYQGDSQLFITPGFQFNTVDALLTNFHLPESTLIMLVSAFAGKERVFKAYRHAVDQAYRFFSYGDAMFLA